MQITILGATGFVGKELLAQALERGFDVKILARDTSKIAEHSASIQVIEGSYFDPDKLREALEGSSAILSTVGPQPKASPDQTTDMYIASLNTIFEEMKAKGIKRFINILGAVTSDPTDKPQTQRTIMRFIMGLIAKHIRETKQAEFQAISHSGVDWTSLRPGMITNTEGTFVAKSNFLAKHKIDVNQLAAFMLDNIETSEWIGKAPLVATV